MQDIPKLPDHAASRTFFTWSVNDAAVKAKIVGEYLKAAGNIRARLDFAFSQHAPARPMPLLYGLVVRNRMSGACTSCVHEGKQALMALASWYLIKVKPTVNLSDTYSRSHGILVCCVPLLFTVWLNTQQHNAMRLTVVRHLQN